MLLQEVDCLNFELPSSVIKSWEFITYTLSRIWLILNKLIKRDKLKVESRTRRFIQCGVLWRGTKRSGKPLKSFFRVLKLDQSLNRGLRKQPCLKVTSNWGADKVMNQRKIWQNESEIGYTQLSGEQVGKKGYWRSAQSESERGQFRRVQFSWLHAIWWRSVEFSSV